MCWHNPYKVFFFLYLLLFTLKSRSEGFKYQPSIWSNHVYARRFERKLSWKHKFPMIQSSFVRCILWSRDNIMPETSQKSHLLHFFIPYAHTSPQNTVHTILGYLLVRALPQRMEPDPFSIAGSLASGVLSHCLFYALSFSFR